MEGPRGEKEGIEGFDNTTRAHSHRIVIQGASHSVYELRPKEVAAVIEEAAQI